MPKANDVLVVEDDLGLQQAVVEALTDEGYSVAAARNGLEALSLLRTMRPRVVLLDFFMPEMIGRELIQIMRARAGLRSIPIIGTSAVERPASVPGMSGFLAKPYTLGVLLGAIRPYVEPRPAQKPRRTHADATGNRNRLKSRRAAKVPSYDSP